MFFVFLILLLVSAILDLIHSCLVMGVMVSVLSTFHFTCVWPLRNINPL